MKVITSIFLAACLSLLLIGLMDRKPSDYEIELAQIENDILILENSSSKAAAGKQDLVKLAYLVYLRAALTADFDHFKIAEIKIDNALQHHGPSQALYLLRTYLNLKLHRLANAKSDLQILQHLSNSPQVKTVKADIDLQEVQGFRNMFFDQPVSGVFFIGLPIMR